ncbi:MAG: hypothetical protein AAB368_17615 [bacterium]
MSNSFIAAFRCSTNFAARFFAYGDDCDLGLRGRLAGWGCAYVPAAVVAHVHSATAGEYSAFKARLIERNLVWVMVKYFPLTLILFSPLLTALRLTVHALGSLFGIGLSGRFARSASRLGLALAILSSYREAVTGLPSMWRARRAFAPRRRVGSLGFLRLLWRHRASLWSVTLGP